MLTSFEVMQAANISRATLNNYISSGLLPRPLVKNPEPGSGTRARQIGYFPDNVLQRIERIQQMKREGYAMTEIVRQLKSEDIAGTETAQPPSSDIVEPRPETVIHTITVADTRKDAAKVAAAIKAMPLRLTIDRIPFPAYMVNYNFEITWYNEEARSELLGEFARLPPDIKDRNALDFLLKGRLGKSGSNREQLLQFYLLLGKGRFSRSELIDKLACQSGVPGSQADQALAGASTGGTITQRPLSLTLEDGGIVSYNVFASYYREGILLIYQPAHAESDSLLGLLERRDEVIRNLLKKRLPALTDVAVLVADLQNSVRICTELPPEEYFELINQIWSTMEPIFRKYYGTHGKHVGDGIMYYFFPQPDCNYIFNALMCAQEMKVAMRKISKEWQLRKNWLNELHLNTGINEGQEWLGIFHVETKVEFTVLGDTINHAARLSDFARGGAIWATKNLLGKLPADKRERVKFGVRRRGADGQDVFVAASYSRIADLANLSMPGNEKLSDIAALPVTEILEVRD